MKKNLLILAMLLCMVPAGAQTLIVDAVKPIENVQYSAYPTGGERLKIVRTYVASGFMLRAPSSGLIDSDTPAYATFDLKGGYAKVTFMLGPARTNSASDSRYSIVTVTGDGRRLLDRVVWCHDPLKYITLDVAGVSKLKFTVLKGGQDVGFGNVKLWKTGQTPVPSANPLDKLPKGSIRLVEQLEPHYIRHSGGYVYTVSKKEVDEGPDFRETISINRKEFTSGLQFFANQGLVSDEMGWSYFWLDKRYDKVSFIVGPRDNQSSNASAWLIVKADKKIIYEEVVTQKDLARQVVLDVAGAEVISFHSERRSSDFLGSITFGVVDMKAYPAGDSSVPVAGELNLSKDRISALPDACPLLSNIRPYSVRGISSADKTLFCGESQFITFSMGGFKYSEGLLLTTGNTLMSDRIDSYATFDLAGEYDWISFDAGCLSRKHVMDDDSLRIYADDRLVFSDMIHCTWPNRHYEVEIGKCRSLRFEKPGNGKKKQTIIGVGDIALYRGRPVQNDLFGHEVPECPDEADLIDVCGSPYFHYVGRYVSSLTNFSMNDCFHNGSTKRECFQMKDGSTINKGFMLETNIPLGLEDVTVMDAAFMFLTGVGGNLSSSDVAAATGTTGGAEFQPGMISLLLFDQNKKQASAAAFNPYGQYETCTFKVANKYAHVDEMAGTFGMADQKNPVKLNIFADQRLVGEYWLDNTMEPMSITVPIFKCTQLMFWLECGEVRSGQYVFYDLKLSKTPCDVEIPAQYTPCSEGPGASLKETSSSGLKQEEVKEEAKKEESQPQSQNDSFMNFDMLKSIMEK